MALETLSTTDLLNYLLNNTISPSPLQPNFLLCNNNVPKSEDALAATGVGAEKRRRPESSTAQQITAVQERKKKRRRQRASKNKEEAESQRMSHIAVERNRRKMMNEHLAVLRSLMPESYAQRGDQASIVGGAIDFLKELEHHLHTLEAQKQILLNQQGSGSGGGGGGGAASSTTTSTHNFLSSTTVSTTVSTNPFSQFFTSPQYIYSPYQNPDHQCISRTEDAAMADIEVTLIETHANVRILTRRKVKQVSKFVTAFHSMYLTILHLNVTTLDPLMVLYSISAKVEEGCVLSSADDIASAVNHILRIIEDEVHDAHARCNSLF